MGMIEGNVMNYLLVKFYIYIHCTGPWIYLQNLSTKGETFVRAFFFDRHSLQVALGLLEPFSASSIKRLNTSKDPGAKNIQPLLQPAIAAETSTFNAKANEKKRTQKKEHKKMS